MRGAGVKDIWTAGRLCDSEVNSKFQNQKSNKPLNCCPTDDLNPYENL